MRVGKPSGGGGYAIAMAVAAWAGMASSVLAQIAPPPPVEFDPARLPAEMQLTAVGSEMVHAEAATPRVTRTDPLAEPLALEMPGDGEIIEETIDEATGVWSAWLSNGVRLHVRSTPVPPGVPSRDAQVTMRITLLGGEVLEDASTRGLTAVVGAMLARPTPEAFRGGEAERALRERSVVWRSGSDKDLLFVQASVPRKYLGWTMQFSHLALAQAQFREREFVAWQREAFTSAQVRSRATWTSVYELANAAMLGDDVRWQPPSLAAIESLSATRASAWLKQAATTWPAEIAIVGPVQVEQVRSDIRRWLASLPKRERVGTDTWAAQRAAKKAPLPLVRRDEVLASIERASIVLGAPAPDEREVEKVQALQIAAELLEARLRRAIPTDAAKLRQSELLNCVVTMAPGAALPGTGWFSVALHARTADLGPALAVAAPILDEFATSGPDESEFTQARDRMVKELRARWQGQEVWVQALATSTYAGLNLAEFARLPDTIAALTRERVHLSFREVWASPAPIRVEILPKIGQRPGILRRMGEPTNRQ